MALEHKTVGLDPAGTEVIERFTGLWDRYGRWITIGLGVVVVGVLGTVFLMRSRTASEEAAAARLAEANVLFFQGDYARSLELSRQVSAQYGSTPSGIEGYRLAGDNAFWNADFKTAVTEYRRYVDKVRAPLLKSVGQRSLAYALESDKQYAEAAATYESLIGEFDRSSSAEFLMAAARSYRLLGQPAEAIKRLERVDQEFGETAYARPARVELAELRAGLQPAAR